MERRKLTAEEIEEQMRLLVGWTIEQDKLTKSYEFETYAGGALFTAAAAQLAEKMDHHPDLFLSYRKVTVSVNTHDVGGISPFDFELARRIDKLI
jgi:4a-hydroxytetrahydrobiopterin dehydratase